jgi:signal transduction histidine kinase
MTLRLLPWLMTALALVMPHAFANEPEHVILQLKWQHQFQFAGYYAAKAKGFYRDAGLDVEIRQAKPDHNPALEVTQGRADFGVSTSNLLLLRAQHEPVVVLGVIYQHSPFVLLTPKSSGVSDIQELSQHPIMMEPDAAELLAYFKNEGISPDSLQLLPHTFDVKDLLNGRATGMSAYSTDEPYELRAEHHDYHIFTPRSGGIDFYGDNLFTTEQQIEQHPERTEAFLQASLRGWEYAMQHPEEIVDLILRDYPTKKSRDQLLFEAQETARLVHPELIQLGYINPGRWQSIAHTYASLGMMPHDFSLQGFIYNPNPATNYHRLFWAAGILLALTLAAISWSMLVSWHNRKLRGEITARQFAEQRAQDESAAKTRFLAMLAHEVRTPLSGIISSIWLFKNLDSPAEKEEVLDIAESSTERLLNLVNNILDQARLESSEMVLESLPVNPREEALSTIQLHQASARAKGISIHFDVTNAVPDSISSDPTRIHQILSNLLSNAIKFSPSAAPVHLSLHTISGDLCFTVKDAGPGLTSEQMGRIFEPFQQAGNSTARTHGGSGLGLAISSQLARILGGKITVSSTPGQGASFTLALPLQPITRQPEIG